MAVVELDGEDVGECLRTWNIYRNILLRTMDERTRIKITVRITVKCAGNTSN